MEQISDKDLKDMLITYMGKGFLENIIDMFKNDPSLVRFIPDMIMVNNLKVRIGVIALVEEISKNSKKELEQIIPSIIELLKHDNPTLKGDVTYILSILKLPCTLPILRNLCLDNNPDVREIALEALQMVNNKP